MVALLAVRAPGPAGWALEPDERALESVGRVSEMAGRAQEPAKRALESAEMPFEASWEAQSHLGGPAERFGGGTE